MVPGKERKMDNFEKVEKLVQKAGVTYEEAKAALEKADGDLLDAMIILEKEGKAEAPKQSSYSTEYEQQTQYVSVEEQVNNDRRNNDKNEQRRERKEKFRNFVDRAKYFLTTNYLIIKRKGNLVADLPFWAALLILLFVWELAIVVFIVSLFFGVTYNFRGESDMSAANNVMGKASDAAEKVKEEFERK